MLKEALQRVARLLDELGVPYALIGGLAVISRGVVRATKDVDFMVDWPREEGTSLARSLSERGLSATFRHGDLFDDPVIGLVRASVPTYGATIQCDILFSSRAWQAEAVRRATSLELEGFAVKVVQSEDLFLLKLHSGGPQDLLDAAELFRLQTPAVRTGWKGAASKHRLSGAYKRCLKFLKDTE
ncbi:MAG TPA: hypothetical protein VGW33_14600 [Terriglobia bacterium]|nr:hypothetical protein [Terriglobia bacterium]